MKNRIAIAASGFAAAAGLVISAAPAAHAVASRDDQPGVQELIQGKLKGEVAQAAFKRCTNWGLKNEHFGPSNRGAYALTSVFKPRHFVFGTLRFGPEGQRVARVACIGPFGTFETGLPRPIKPLGAAFNGWIMLYNFKTNAMALEYEADTGKGIDKIQVRIFDNKHSTPWRSIDRYRQLTIGYNAVKPGVFEPEPGKPKVWLSVRYIDKKGKVHYDPSVPRKERILMDPNERTGDVGVQRRDNGARGGSARTRIMTAPSAS